MRQHLLVFGLLAGVAGCLDGFGSAGETARGGPGYPCYYDVECASPLTCQTTAGMRGPVCSGTAGAGQACGEGVACRYQRDEQGLPLRCGGDGLCTFPTRAAAR